MRSRLSKLFSRFAFYLLLAVLVAVGANWFASGTGDMVLEWKHYELTTTTSNFVFLVVILVVFLSVIIPWVLGLFGLKKWLKARDEKKFRQGLDHVTNTLAAVAIGDTKAAAIALNKARKSLDKQPIIPLLETQIAAATQDQDLLQKSLGELQEFKQTKALAAKGLAEMHMRKGELTSAIPFAEKAMELEPENKQSFEITLSLYVKSKQFIYAENLIEDAKKQKIIDKYETKDLTALIAYLRSIQDELTDEEAKKHVAEAYESAAHRPHIFLHYIKLHNEGVDVEKAVKVLKRSWEGCFTPALYSLAKEIALGEKEKKKLYSKLMNLSLTGKPLANLLLADLAMDKQDSKEALKQLAQYNESTGNHLELPDADAEGDMDYERHIAEAFKLAEEGVGELRWACDNCKKESSGWQVICPSCQTFNSCGIVSV